MKYKNIIIAFMVVLFFGCEDYLDVVPEKDLTTIESIFTKRMTALNFFNGCYKHYMGTGTLKQDPAMSGGDEFMTCPHMRTGNRVLGGFQIAEGLQNTSDPILPLWDTKNNVYNSIVDCNTFIEHVDEVYNMDDEEKRRYKASAKAIKALYYFELMRMYGPIPLLPKNISVEADIETMQIKRSPIDTIVNRIVELFDEAFIDIDASQQQTKNLYGLLTKEAVIGYKAKALVYAASPLFNGNPWYSKFKNRDGEQLFNPDYDLKKWERAAKAVDEAIEYCESQGKRLEEDYVEETSQLLNTIRNVQLSAIGLNGESPELLHGVPKGIDIQYKLPRYSEKNKYFDGRIYGFINPTMRMVELYYTDKGLPINMDRTWDFSNKYKNGYEKDTKYKNVVCLDKAVLNLHLRREPRFYANIGFDRGIWLMGKIYEEMCPYKGGIHGFDYETLQAHSKVNLTGYWIKKGIHPNNQGRKGLYHLSSYGPHTKLRMADLYLMQAEAWNEIGGPTPKVYGAINKIRERAGILNVEDAWKDYSKQPNKVKTKAGMRDIIREETLIEFAFEGHRFWDLRRWKIAHNYMTTPLRGWNILEDNNEDFYNKFKGPIVVWKENEFESPRDYFWPIRDEEVLKANVAQNPGW